MVLGWRGQVTDTVGFFGLAEGRFQPERANEFFARQQLPFRQYADLELYAFGSGEDRADLFFAFLSSPLAAFGRLNDLKALLDVRAGARNPASGLAAFLQELKLETSGPRLELSGSGALEAADEIFSPDPEVEGF